MESLELEVLMSDQPLVSACRKLKLPGDIEEDAKELYRMTQEVSTLSGLRPRCKMATCIYMCLEDKTITQRKLSEVFETTDVSIRNTFQKIIQRGEFTTPQLKKIKERFIKVKNKKKWR